MYLIFFALMLIFSGCQMGANTGRRYIISHSTVEEVPADHPQTVTDED